jgi:hypothetical protein
MITKKDIRILRSKLSHVSFISRENEPHGEMIVHRAPDKFHSITVKTKVDAFGEAKQREFKRASETSHVYDTDHHGNIMDTIAAFIKDGDEVELVWVADNNNGYIMESRYMPEDGRLDYGSKIHRDELVLVIHRKGKKFPFKIESHVTPDNTARPIQFH